MDDRTLRLAVLLSAHVIFLSAGALRILRGQRGHLLRTQAPWWIQYYPPLVWVPFLIAYGQAAWAPTLLPATDLANGLQLAGLALALLSALFAAWGMWSLGPSYGIRLDLFAEHVLHTGGAFGLVRHPMYSGIVGFHLGASLALESALLLVLTALVVVPLTLARIAGEERVLREAFPAYAAYAARTPALIPFGR
jgi:protein-S-isoprenylcysteine O-methyltransferase Ste14